MTDHPTPATPEATEREARRIMFALAQKYGCDYPESWQDDAENHACAGCIRDLEQFAAAVRAAERARCIAVVEGMLTEEADKHGGTEAEDFRRARNRTLHAIIYALRARLTEEG